MAQGKAGAEKRRWTVRRTIERVRTIGYTVKFQTEEKYKSIRYGQGTIYSSACGPASLCNALQVLGIADSSIPTMCGIAVAAGARVEGGTLMRGLV